MEFEVATTSFTSACSMTSVLHNVVVANEEENVYRGHDEGLW